MSNNNQNFCVIEYVSNGHIGTHILHHLSAPTAEDAIASVMADYILNGEFNNCQREFSCNNAQWPLAR